MSFTLNRAFCLTAFPLVAQFVVNDSACCFHDGGSQRRYCIHEHGTSDIANAWKTALMI